MLSNSNSMFIDACLFNFLPDKNDSIYCYTLINKNLIKKFDFFDKKVKYILIHYYQYNFAQDNSSFFLIINEELSSVDSEKLNKDIVSYMASCDLPAEEMTNIEYIRNHNLLLTNKSSNNINSFRTQFNKFTFQR